MIVQSACTEEDKKECTNPTAEGICLSNKEKAAKEICNHLIKSYLKICHPGDH